MVALMWWLFIIPCIIISIRLALNTGRLYVGVIFALHFFISSLIFTFLAALTACVFNVTFFGGLFFWFFSSITMWGCLKMLENTPAYLVTLYGYILYNLFSIII